MNEQCEAKEDPRYFTNSTRRNNNIQSDFATAGTSGFDRNLCQPEKRPEIDESLNALSNKISLLQDNLNQLAAMLDPVLSCENPQCDNNKVPHQYQSPLAQSIEDQKARVNDLISKANDLISRIQL